MLCVAYYQGDIPETDEEFYDDIDQDVFDPSNEDIFVQDYDDEGDIRRGEE